MGGFTRDEGKHLQDILGGRRADQARRKKKRDADFARNPGRVLREELLRKIEGAIPDDDKIDRYRLEEIIGAFWEELRVEHRDLLTADLARQDLPATDSGEVLALKYCTAELKKRGYRVSPLSEWARKLIDDIINDVGDLEIGPIYELVVEKLDTGSWQECGPLKLMGYTVGNQGLPTKQRRLILWDTIRVRLKPSCEDFVEYINAWGRPLSPTRLDKIIAAITRSISLAEMNWRADYSKAITDWREDLRWLTHAYNSIPWP